MAVIIFSTLEERLRAFIWTVLPLAGGDCVVVAAVVVVVVVATVVVVVMAVVVVVVAAVVVVVVAAAVVVVTVVSAVVVSSVSSEEASSAGSVVFAVVAAVVELAVCSSAVAVTVVVSLLSAVSSTVMSLLQEEVNSIAAPSRRDIRLFLKLMYGILLYYFVLVLSAIRRLIPSMAFLLSSFTAETETEIPSSMLQVIFPAVKAVLPSLDILSVISEADT